MKRIFTKRLVGLESVAPTLTAGYGINAWARWTVQEDILLIGAELEVYTEVWGMTGTPQLIYAGVMAELSQSGERGQDPVFLRLFSEPKTETLNTPVTVGISDGFAPLHEVVMFPEGMCIPVKEEGSIYLNGFVWNAHPTLDLLMHAQAILYYVKGVIKKG